MKYFKLFTVLLCSAVISLTACKEEAKTQKLETATPTKETQPFTPPTNPTQNTTTADPAQNAMGVWHYTCPQGCAGGSGTASKCGTCGALLAHNVAYHGNPNASQSPSIPLASPGTPVAAPVAAQNAAGIWHYSCSKGCAGGSGTAGNCTTCGDPLAHNVAFHQ